MDSLSDILTIVLGSSLSLLPVILLVIWRQKKKQGRRDADESHMEFIDGWVGGPSMGDSMGSLGGPPGTSESFYQGTSVDGDRKP